MPGTTPPVKATIGAKQKTWAGNYRFQVPGMPTNRVSMIEPFTISRKVTSDPAAGDVKSATLEPSQWQIPNLVFYMPPQDSLAWLKWHEDFVIDGNNSDAKEKTFLLDLLSQDTKDTFLELQGSGVGIVSAKYEASATATTSVAQGFRVELYVESMKIVAAANSTNTPPDTSITGTTTIKMPATRPMVPGELQKRLPGR
jgi:hypothetical protein